MNKYHEKAVRWADKGTMCAELGHNAALRQRVFTLSWAWNAIEFGLSVRADISVDSGGVWRQMDKEYARWQRQKETPT